MSPRTLAVLAMVFAVLALVSGAAQVWAFIASSRPGHLVSALFALGVGISVAIAAGAALLRKR